MSIAVMSCESDIWMSPGDQVEALIALQAHERQRLAQRLRIPVAQHGGYTDALAAQTLPEALAAYHLSATLDDSGALIALENSCGNFHFNTLDLFNVLAPYVRHGSTITWRVEDASGASDFYEYRWTFTDGAVQEQATAIGMRQAAADPNAARRRRRGQRGHDQR